MRSHCTEYMLLARDSHQLRHSSLHHLDSPLLSVFFSLRYFISRFISGVHAQFTIFHQDYPGVIVLAMQMLRPLPTPTPGVAREGCRRGGTPLHTPCFCAEMLFMPSMDYCGHQVSVRHQHPQGKRLIKKKKWCYIQSQRVMPPDPLNCWGRISFMKVPKALESSSLSSTVSSTTKSSLSSVSSSPFPSPRSLFCPCSLSCSKQTAKNVSPFI